jgi:hypothetical protein
MSGFATLSDKMPSEVKAQGSGKTDEQPRMLLAYIRCLDCKEQVVIQTCAVDPDQRCSEDGQKPDDPNYNMHTHIVCRCGERRFSGVVSFRTTRDTDAFNVKKKMTWEEKKNAFKK